MAGSGSRLPFSMEQGDTITDKRQIEVGLQSDLDSRTATIHILQHQPTSRPIEDRYSIDVRMRDEVELEAGETTLLLGVYDGHRGSSAAAYVAQALPSDVLSTAAHPTQATEGQTRLIQDTFDAFDIRMLSSFQEVHPKPTKSPRRMLSSLATKFLKTKRQNGDEGKSGIAEESTTAALRVLSGSTASMLLVKVPHSHRGTPSAKIINLGDSRVVVASFTPEPMIYATSVDINSGVKDEQSFITSQHPGDDPNDIFVGGRLFGETLSTRAIGDGIYKLPLRANRRMATQDTGGEPPNCPELTSEQQHQHKDLIQRLSAHQQAAAASKGKAKIIPLIDRYDALFWAYKSPPYVSATPQVTEVPLDFGISGQEDSRNPQGSHPIVALLATDGLWDMISSKEAVDILSKALNQSAPTSVMEELNVARILFDEVVERAARKPGDDVTILVLVL